MIRPAFISLAVIFLLTSCAETQYLTRTVYVREPVPAEYLTPTPTPGPKVNVIDYCPDYVETLKKTVKVCNDDKLDVLDWDKAQAEKVQEMNAK
ncbi:hypothetical protein DET64_105219 [Marinobacter nauticus]|uniref:Entry exclusion lipoprotein TrbK n=1 Tax=Marinobacter nauticus TaxID=2743 RepID=A0A368V138_MARNT|nr:hypothetical protein DET64_105219 [Marinobacter nauticus]RCW34842.1 hypothetical protein DET51_105218 [Marinobacter nauticus]